MPTTIYKNILSALMTVAAAVVLLVSGVHAYRQLGFPCRAHFQCQSMFCNERRVCQAKLAVGEPCVGHAACESMRCSGGVCQVQQQPNGTCAVNEDCFEGWCFDGECSPWIERKALCEFDHQCQSGRCTNNPRVCEFVIYEPNICGKDSDCNGTRCKKDRGINKCIARKLNLESCVDNGDCLSLRCEMGNCTEPNWLEGECDEPSDCYSVLCNKEDNMCVATADEADISEEYDPQYGISGSVQAEHVYVRNGTVDISGPGTFGGEGGGSNSNPEGSAALRNFNAVKYASTVLAAGAFVFYLVA